jgi:hypothetical protein
VLALATGELAENKFTGRLYVKTESAAVVDPARVILSGDVTGNTATATSEAQAGTIAATVARIQGRTVASTTPTTGQSLAWNNTTSQWEPTSVGGASSSPGWMSFSRARVKKFTATATYTAPAGLSGFLVIGIGAHGTISPVLAAGTAQYQAHGAQGGASYSEKYYASPATGGTYNIVIGASGGNTTFASTGMVLTSSSNITTVAGGTGGTATGGDFNASGGTGGASINTSVGGCCPYFTGNSGGAGGAGSRLGNGGNGVSATGSLQLIYAEGGLGGVNGTGTTHPTISGTTLASGISSLVSTFDDISTYLANNGSANYINNYNSAWDGFGAAFNKIFGAGINIWPETPSISKTATNTVFFAGTAPVTAVRGNYLSAGSAGAIPTHPGVIFVIEFYS